MLTVTVDVNFQNRPPNLQAYTVLSGQGWLAWSNSAVIAQIKLILLFSHSDRPCKRNKPHKRSFIEKHKPVLYCMKVAREERKKHSKSSA